MPRLGAMCPGKRPLKDSGGTDLEVLPENATDGESPSRGIGALCCIRPLPTEYGVCGGNGERRGATYAGADTSTSTLRSSQSSANAIIALSGREANMREARMNSPRIYAR